MVPARRPGGRLKPLNFVMKFSFQLVEPLHLWNLLWFGPHPQSGALGLTKARPKIPVNSSTENKKLFIKNDIFSISSNLSARQSLSTQGSTTGLISDSFFITTVGLSPPPPSAPLKALFDVRIYLRLNTPGLFASDSGLGRNMRKNFHLFIFKLKIKFQKFLVAFISLLREMFVSISDSRSLSRH